MTIRYNSKTKIFIRGNVSDGWEFIIERKSGRKGKPATYILSEDRYARPWTARRGAVRACAIR